MLVCSTKMKHFKNARNSASTHPCYTSTFLILRDKSYIIVWEILIKSDPFKLLPSLPLDENKHKIQNKQNSLTSFYIDVEVDKRLKNAKIPNCNHKHSSQREYHTFTRRLSRKAWLKAIHPSHYHLLHWIKINIKFKTNIMVWPLFTLMLK